MCGEEEKGRSTKQDGRRMGMGRHVCGQYLMFHVFPGTWDRKSASGRSPLQPQHIFRTLPGKRRPPFPPFDDAHGNGGE